MPLKFIHNKHSLSRLHNYLKETYMMDFVLLATKLPIQLRLSDYVVLPPHGEHSDGSQGFQAPPTFGPDPYVASPVENLVPAGGRHLLPRGSCAHFHKLLSGKG